MAQKQAEGLIKPDGRYRLDDQVGYLLRRAQQRHLSIFSDLLPDMTPMQFAAMSRLYKSGSLSQNELGRQASMDAATIKGVVDRLRKRGLVSTRRDDRDQRRIYLELTGQGRRDYEACTAKASEITARTIAPLSEAEHRELVTLLRKIT